MKNRVYYGEYSLMHWIDLILKRNIILPEYQRFFVWNEEKTKTLIETFKKKQFIPPVTIGAFIIEEKCKNLVLDGQQRLTSIFLAYLGLFPDKKTFLNKTRERFADENDNLEEEDQFDNVLEWTFDKLLERGSDRIEILSNIVEGNYKKINLDIDENFFKTTYLGFSYLVPQKVNGQTEEKFNIEQQKFYSSVFRNINIQGEILLAQESRESLYFLDKNKVDFFNPNFCKDIIVNDAKVDFVRYLSLLFQYNKDCNISNVARGYARKMEKYYEEFIYSVVGENDSQIFSEFSKIFINGDYTNVWESLKSEMRVLKFFRSYDSIIDLDIHLFGLIYVIVFNKRRIDDNNIDELNKKLGDKIGQCRQNDLHKKNPSAFKYLRERIISSIEIYGRYSI